MEQNSKTWLWVVVAVVVVAALGMWMWWSNRVVAPATSETAGPALTAEDTTSAIGTELNATDLGDVDKELQSIEADVNSL